MRRGRYTTSARARDSGTFVPKTLEQGAATTVLVATAPELKGVGGRYFEDGHEAAVLGPNAPQTSASGVAACALDAGAAAQLWDVSERAVTAV